MPQQQPSPDASALAKPIVRASHYSQSLIQCATSSHRRSPPTRTTTRGRELRALLFAFWLLRLLTCHDRTWRLLRERSRRASELHAHRKHSSPSRLGRAVPVRSRGRSSTSPSVRCSVNCSPRPKDPFRLEANDYSDALYGLPAKRGTKSLGVPEGLIGVPICVNEGRSLASADYDDSRRRRVRRRLLRALVTFAAQ